MAGDESDEKPDSEDLYEHYNISVDKGQSLVRIDKFLFDRLAGTSRNRIQNAARAGNILVNRKKEKPSYKVKPGDQISIVLPYPVREIELVAENIPLTILYEDDELIVLNKEAGMVVHPAYGNYKGTLVNALMYHFQNLPVKAGNEHGRPGLVHRLDKNTSGIMVIAKTEYAMTHLARQFYERTSERTYCALVWGIPKLSKGTVTGNIGRNIKDRKIFQWFAPESGIGKHAVTHYEVLESMEHVSLVQCKLETGRTHQIRVHMQYLGHPLFNDPEYGGQQLLRGQNTQKYKLFVENNMKLIPGQALHAKTLGIEHPVTGKWMQFDSELPKGFKQVVENWRKGDFR